MIRESRVRIYNKEKKRAISLVMAVMVVSSSIPDNLGLVEGRKRKERK